MKNYLTIDELATVLKTSQWTLYKLAEKGEIPGFKVGKKWLFDLEEVEKELKRKHHARKNR